ncbi:MAG: 7TM-DISM domain-containing protein [Rhodoferax sp.]
MPSRLLRLLVAIASLLWGGWGNAWADAANTLPLQEDTAMELRDGVQVWLETGRAMAVEAAAAERYQSATLQQHFPLDESNTLWLRLRVQRAAPAAQRWSLYLPLPFVDEVTLYQTDAQGRWQAQRAGDTLPLSEWGRAGLYPDFDLHLPDTAPRELLLRVRNFKHLSLPLRLAPAAQRDGQRLLEWLLLGTLLGSMLAVCALCAVRYLEHRQTHDLWAAGFGALIAMTTAQINGVLGATLWAAWPAWGNIAYSLLPVWAVGASLLFVRMLYTLSTQYHRYDQFLGGVGLLTLGASLAYFIDRPHAEILGDGLLLLATTTGLVATFLSRKGHSPLWIFMLAAYAPQSLCLMRLLLDAMGVLPHSWQTRYLFSLSVAASLPLLTYALNLATHDRKELQLRERHLPTQDALTGLLTREAFATEVEKAYHKAVDAREPIALVLVRVVNYEHIRKGMGDTVAEQSLLRAVVKLHRVLRDTDPAGRIDADLFGLLLDGVVTRQQLTERMVQLVASGLVPLPGLHPPITLQFQAACVLLHDNPIAPTVALGELQEVLRGMSVHTRRPIRFLEAPQTVPVDLSAPSSAP